MAQTEIPDSLPEELPDKSAPEAPYRSLWIPLIVVPALIVMVLILIWTLFGAIAGEEASPGQNLSRMIHGTSNERDQASMLLVRQIVEHLESVREGGEPEWEIDPSFLPEVQRAWEDTDPEELRFRYVLAVIQARLDDPSGVPNLLGILEASEVDDSDGQIRFLALLSLGALADRMGASHKEDSAERVSGFLDDPDPGLRQAAAIALQGLPGEVSIAALRQALRDGVLSVRGNAAISLSHLGDPEASSVLHELLDPEVYAQERGRSPGLWTRAQDISKSRIMAVKALARLGRPEDIATLRSVARDDADINVRGAALAALDDFQG
jgi:HEAT repeat protein